ncbi:MAG: hypothetical protein WC644_10985 [Ignavibacteria bacterium]
MRLLKKTQQAKGKTEAKSPAVKTAKKSTEDEIAIAIGTAIYLYTQQQFTEKQDLKMTIKRTDRPYTPWGQKIYMMRKWPR